jgi:hypothetical protein
MKEEPMGGIAMGKILVGVITAAAWFILSHAANAERVCQQACDNGTCISKCVGSDSTVIVHDHDGPGSYVERPGADVEIGR